MAKNTARVMLFLFLALLFVKVLAADQAKVVRIVKIDSGEIAVARLQYAEIEFAYAGLNVREGDTIDVSFGCQKDGVKCPSAPPDQLVVNGSRVHFLGWYFPDQVHKACVHHGPASSVHGKFDDSYSRGLIVDVRVGKGTLFMTLLFDGGVAPSELADLKRKDSVEIIFPSENPNVAVVRGVEIKIEARSFQDEAFELCKDR